MLVDELLGHNIIPYATSLWDLPRVLQDRGGWRHGKQPGLCRMRQRRDRTPSRRSGAYMDYS
ncbi:MAG: family 1 glycosylhydrolase [Chloroflexota bacterium]